MFKFSIIATREFKRYLYSPISWLILSLWTLLTGFFFIRFVFESGQEAEMRGLMLMWAWTLIPIIPALSMRLIAEELRSGSLEILMTRPLGETQAILGKWLGAFGFIMLMMACTLPQIILLYFYSEPDWGPIITGYCGLILTAALYLSIGIFASTLAKDQVMVFMISIFLILLFTVVIALLQDITPKEFHPLLLHFSIIHQTLDLRKGVLDIQSLVFFVTGILLFLLLSIKSLEARRWSESIKKYGPNVMVQLFLFLAILIGLNWGATELAKRNPYPDIPKRIDLTALGRYSLSDQTKLVIQNLDQEITITSLYARSGDNEQTINYEQRVGDLIGEYNRASGGKIQVREIDPFQQTNDYELFNQSIRDRFKPELDLHDQALVNFDQHLEREKAFALEQRKLIGENANQLSMAQRGNLNRLNSDLTAIAGTVPEEQLKQLTIERNLNVDQLKNIDIVRQLVKLAMERALPNYALIIRRAREHLSIMKHNVLPPAMAIFEQIRQSHPEGSATEQYASKAIKDITDLQNRISVMLAEFEGLQADQYHAVADALSSNTIVLSTEERIMVLPFNTLFPVKGEDNSDIEIFRGEEAITGALLGLQEKVMPQIIFLTFDDNPRSVYFQNVVNPLRAMGFEVYDHNAMNRGAIYGQPMQNMSFPQPAEGQKQIFIVTPSPDPSDIQSIPNQKLARRLVESKINQGGARLMYLIKFQRAGGLNTDPETDILGLTRLYGLNPLPNNLIITSELRASQMEIERMIEIESWPEDDHAHPVHTSVKGMKGVVYDGVPIDIIPERPEHIQVWSLVKSTEDSWEEAPPYNINARKHDVDRAGPFTMVAAAENSQTDSRVVVFGSVDMVTDVITDTSEQSRLGTRYPANGELFVSSIYWLAGMEDMIAATPRSKKIAYVQEIPTNLLNFYWGFLLVGFPVGMLFMAGFTWYLRRK